jgi:hypothetical protein
MFDRHLDDLTREELIRLWIEEGKSDSMIAAQFHTTASKVRRRRKELGVFLGCTSTPLENLSVPELLHLQISICRKLEQLWFDKQT